MLRGASVKSRLRRMDCAARCDPVKASRSSRRTQISPGARRERTIPPAWSRAKSLSEQDAVGKAGLRRAEFERAGWQREKEQIQKIRCVGFCPEGRFVASLYLESRQTGRLG